MIDELFNWWDNNELLVSYIFFGLVLLSSFISSENKAKSLIFIAVAVGAFFWFHFQFEEELEQKFGKDSIEQCFTHRQGCMSVNCIHRYIEEEFVFPDTKICEELAVFLEDPKYKARPIYKHVSKGSCERYMKWIEADNPRPELQVDYIRNEWKKRLQCDQVRLPDSRKYDKYDWAKILMFEH